MTDTTTTTTTMTMGAGGSAAPAAPGQPNAGSASASTGSGAKNGRPSGQFVREACYATLRGQRRPTKSGGRIGNPKASAGEVIGEILRRAPKFYQHLTLQGLEPHPPTKALWGIEPDKLLDWYMKLAATAARFFEERLVGGQVRRYRQRKSTTILGTAICSYPGKADEKDADYRRWRELVVAWARQRYGDRLATVIEHTDEAYGHIHVVFHNAGRSVRPLMAGHGAALAGAKAGLSKVKQKELYLAGCKTFQDDFQRLVGRHVGLGRRGPASKRRNSWAAARANKILEEERQALRDRVLRAHEGATRMAEWLRDRVAEGLMREDEADDLAAQGGFRWRERVAPKA